MYYCLISSLTDLTLSSDATRIDFAALRQEIRAELSGADLRSVELLYSYHDVQNLLYAMSGSDLPHNELGNLTREQIQIEIKAEGTDDEPFLSLLPRKIRASLDLYQERTERDEETEPIADIERVLLSDFYRECETSKCEFLRNWADADRNIRNTAAREQYIATANNENLNEQSWWGTLQAVISTTDFVEREHKMDAMRWDLIEELSQGHYFDIDSVMAYMLKLNILQRWAYLNKEFGRERFERLVRSFTKDINV